MEDSNSLQAPAIAPQPSGTDRCRQRHGILAHLKSPKGVLIVAIGLEILSLVAWRFGAAALSPLVYGLPCAAMMAMCMRSHGGANTASARPDDWVGSRPDKAQ